MSTEKAINAARERVVDAVKKVRSSGLGAGWPSCKSELDQALTDLETLEAPFEYTVIGHVSEIRFLGPDGQGVVFCGTDARGFDTEVLVQSEGMRASNLRAGVTHYKISITEDTCPPDRPKYDSGV